MSLFGIRKDIERASDQTLVSLVHVEIDIDSSTETLQLLHIAASLVHPVAFGRLVGLLGPRRRLCNAIAPLTLTP